MSIVKILLLTGAVLLSSGCANSESAEPVNMTKCKDPRPQMCTMDYTPVCGVDKDGNKKTYSNGCGACSNPHVVSYQDGACDENTKKEKQ